MRTDRYFTDYELEQVAQAVHLAEDLVNTYYKLSPGSWLKNRYDIKTARDLASHEVVIGPFAQVVKYEGRRKDVPLGSSSFSLYAICLQDSAIIGAIITHPELKLSAFLLYILVHELVHVVRFLKYNHRYEYASEASVTLAEEKRVHRITYEILSCTTVAHLQQAFDFFGKWLHYNGS